MIHASLSSLGWVVGGAETVLRAAFEAIGKTGTLVMPCETPQCADPTDWAEPKFGGEILETIRAHMPCFDSDITPTKMGAIAECFRTWPGTLRSYHPLTSVSANGPLAHEITSEHSIEYSEGEGTPFEKVFELDFSILLLGVGFNRCTMLHFAESRVDNRRTTTSRFPLNTSGMRVWMEVEDMAADNSTHFPAAGKTFMEKGSHGQAKIGEADSVLFKAKDLVNHAEQYFEGVL